VIFSTVWPKPFFWECASYIPNGSVDAPTACSATLPTVEYRGEGLTEYPLGDGFEVCVIKRRDPFRLWTEAPKTNDDGESVYLTERPDERVWACAGHCDFPPIYKEPFEIGYMIAPARSSS